MDFVLGLHNQLSAINDQVKEDFTDRHHRQRELVRRFTEFLGASDHVEPFAHKVLCDVTNNPPSVVETGKVRIDVFLKLKSDPVDRERQMWFD